MSCTIPANQPIYAALLDKAASYPTDKVWQACAYRAAAETVRNYEVNIYQEYAKYNGFVCAPMTIGKGIEKFIYDFIKAESVKPVEPATKCTVPANEPIYAALLAKAESYPTDKVYQSRAYRAAAETVCNYEKDIYTMFAKYNGFCPYAPTAIGKSIDQFIYDFIKDPKSVLPAPPAEPATKCTVSTNNGLYNALLHRASKTSNKYSAKYYTDAAAKVLASPRSIPDAWAVGRGEEAISDLKVGPSIVAYIKHYCNEIKGGKVFKYPSTDDEKAMEALKIYCIKNNLAYIPALQEEYKKWLATASKWELEEYDYETQKYKPKSVAMIATTWAAYYSTALKPLNVANKYKQGVINFCKKNNIIYQPVMLERLDAWREANKDKLVNTFPGCGCGSECDGGKVNTYPMGHVAVINRWFATLPKTVSL